MTKPSRRFPRHAPDPPASTPALDRVEQLAKEARQGAKLNDLEAERLAACERKIEAGLQTFIEVGEALLTIRDDRLYRQEYSTFESYCRMRWGFSDRRARQIIAAAEIGTIVPVVNEAQARELLYLKDKPDKMREVWDRVRERGKPTAEALNREVKAVIHAEADANFRHQVAVRSEASEPALAAVRIVRPEPQPVEPHRIEITTEAERTVATAAVQLGRLLDQLEAVNTDRLHEALPQVSDEDRYSFFSKCERLRETLDRFPPSLDR